MFEPRTYVRIIWDIHTVHVTYRLLEGIRRNIKILKAFVTTADSWIHWMRSTRVVSRMVKLWHFSIFLVPVPPTPSTGKARANHTKVRLKRAKARQHPVSVGQVGGTPPVSEDALQKAMFTEAQRTGALALKRAQSHHVNGFGASPTWQKWVKDIERHSMHRWQVGRFWGSDGVINEAQVIFQSCCQRSTKPLL